MTKDGTSFGSTDAFTTIFFVRPFTIPIYFPVCTLVALIYLFVSRTPTRPNCPDSAFRSARPRAPPSHPPSTIWRMGSPDAKRSSAPATPGSFRREQPPPSPLVRSCDSRCDLISSRLRRLFLPSGPWGRNHSPDPCIPSIPSHPEDWSLCLCLDETLACSRWPSLTSTPIRHDRCSRQGSNASCPPRRGATAAQVDLGTGFPKGYDCGSSILPSRTTTRPCGPCQPQTKDGIVASWKAPRSSVPDLRFVRSRTPA